MNKEIIGFSNIIELTLEDNVKKKFKSEIKAIQYLMVNYPNCFTKKYIYDKIKKKDLSVVEWLKESSNKRLADYKGHYRGANVDMLNDINFNRSTLLCKQLDIINIAKYSDNNDKTKENKLLSYKGFCMWDSLFCAVPQVFDYSLSEVIDTLENIDYETLKQLSGINKWFVKNKNVKPFKYTTDLSLIETNIDYRAPCVLNISGRKTFGNAHAVSVFGYDKTYYYFYENGIGEQFLDIIANLKLGQLLEKEENFKKWLPESEQHLYKLEDSLHQYYLRNKYTSLINEVKKHIGTKYGKYTGIKRKTLMELAKIDDINVWTYYPDIDSIKPINFAFQDLLMRVNNIYHQNKDDFLAYEIVGHTNW